MAMRFRRSKKIAPGVRLTLGKGSASVRFGPRGIEVSKSTTGREKATVGGMSSVVPLPSRRGLVAVIGLPRWSWCGSAVKITRHAACQSGKFPAQPAKVRLMSYRELAAVYAAEARSHLDVCNNDEDAVTRFDGADPIRTDRQFMSRLNLAKTCAVVSQAYSALVSIEPAAPRVVTL